MSEENGGLVEEIPACGIEEKKGEDGDPSVEVGLADHNVLLEHSPFPMRARGAGTALVLQLQTCETWTVEVVAGGLNYLGQDNELNLFAPLSLSAHHIA